MKLTASPKETKQQRSEANPASVNKPVNKPNLEVRVGMFTVIAFVIFLYGQAWLKQFSIMHPPQRITVQFHDVAGLANNAPVNINGVRVGTVEKIELEGKGRVRCRLKIKTEEATVPQGSTFTIQTLGLVGAKYIEISLPEEKPGEEPRPPIDPDTVVVGDDPVRVELVVNKIATNLNRMITRISDDSTQRGLADALQYSGETIKNINEAAQKLNKNMDKISDVTASVKTTSDRFGDVAVNAKSFFITSNGTMASYKDLSRNLQKTSNKVNSMLDDPQLRGDIKETIKMAQQTALTIRETMKDLNVTLKDKDLRTDILSALERVNKSTQDISKSMDELTKISNNGELRGDIKEIVNNAKEAVAKVEGIMAEPEFKSDLRKTIRKVEDAATNVDGAAIQMRQILNKRAPLFQMMFRSPGRVKEEKKTTTTETKPDGKGGEQTTKKVETKTTTETEAAPVDTKPSPSADSEQPELRQ
jgi:phospholipid/cholesterol/gamma-HCH transport system substrate-binding protein